MKRRWRRTRFALPSLCVSMLCLGCGGGDKPLVLVAGKATYAGGEWPMPGTITFTPLNAEGGQIARPGSARFQPDGQFVVGSYRPGDGLMPGKYHVSISCIDPLDFSKPREQLEFVPQDFHVDDLIVEAGQDAIELFYKVPKKK